MGNTTKLVYNLLRAKIKKKPYKLNFTVTSFCNSKCITCNIWKNPISNNELSIQELETIFQKLPNTICWLSLTGGEPFSRTDFVDIFKTAIKNIPNLSLIGVPTNGLYQNRVFNVAQEMMKIKNHPRIIITFSIDGPEETHDYVRGVPGGFKRTWDTYVKLKELVKDDKNFTVGVETTISSKNLETVFPFIEKLVNENHFISLTFAHEAYLYQNTTGDSAKGIIPQDVEKIEEILNFFKRKFRFWHPQDIIEKSYLNNVPRYLRNPKEKPVPCTSLITTISMDAFGSITPCLMWGKKLGNIREQDYDLNGIYNSELSEQTRKEIKENKCPNCWTPCEAYQSVLWSKLRLN